jgi:hypothetical protein
MHLFSNTSKSLSLACGGLFIVFAYAKLGVTLDLAISGKFEALVSRTFNLTKFFFVYIGCISL